MQRLPRRIITLVALLFLAPDTWAEENATAQEVRELRQAVNQQTKQIELLAEQVGRLTRAMQAQKAPEEPVPALGEAAPARNPVPAAAPGPDAPKVEFSTGVGSAPKVETVPKAEGVPKAEAVAGGLRHAVAKGETLTSIAKQYNIPLSELQKTNKIENDRKLQIGQILVVPTAKAPETPDNKANP